MSSRDERKYLDDMRLYGREAVDMVSGVSRDAFLTTRTLQLAVTHLVQVIGEAASRVSEDTRRQFPSIPWSDIVGMRHRLVHDYGNVSYEFVWDVATKFLQPLIIAIDAAIPPDPPQP